MTLMFEVSGVWNDALTALGNAIEATYGENPMGNTGARYDGTVFSAHAYSWSDDDQPWNFKWHGVRISWYKYSGRCCKSNVILPPKLATTMLVECLAGLSHG